MTHDELLEKIDEEGEFLVQHFDSKPRVHSALRAVVEYHKPCDNGTTLSDYNGPIFGNCEGCRRSGVRVKWESCHITILIQKELG